VELTESFELANVIKHGHFKLTSGRHSDTYINKNLITTDAVLFNVVMIKLMCKTLEFDNYNLITGPATAGAVLAAALATTQNKAFIYPEKIINPDATDFTMQFRRGFDKIMRNKRILLIEDVITTGGSVQKTIDSIEHNGGRLVGVIAIWNRSGWEPSNYKIESLINEPVDSWEPDECPLCKEGVLLTDPKM
jgi:orotate phosphoribosyltransferase